MNKEEMNKIKELKELFDSCIWEAHHHLEGDDTDDWDYIEQLTTIEKKIETIFNHLLKEKTNE